LPVSGLGQSCCSEPPTATNASTQTPYRIDALLRLSDHLGFGASSHAGVGMKRTCIEMLAPFSALAKRLLRCVILEQAPLLKQSSARLQDITDRHHMT
jgi:hypothetical protein